MRYILIVIFFSCLYSCDAVYMVTYNIDNRTNNIFYIDSIVNHNKLKIDNKVGIINNDSITIIKIYSKIILGIFPRRDIKRIIKKDPFLDRVVLYKDSLKNDSIIYTKEDWKVYKKGEAILKIE